MSGLPLRKDPVVTYTKIALNEEETEFVFSCDVCGANADKPENVKHYKNCNEQAKIDWDAYYNDPAWKAAVESN
jgi:hypothetical protein